MLRMKEIWFYHLNLFENSEKTGKAIKKSQKCRRISGSGCSRVPRLQGAGERRAAVVQTRVNLGVDPV